MTIADARKSDDPPEYWDPYDLDHGNPRDLASYVCIEAVHTDDRLRSGVSALERAEGADSEARRQAARDIYHWLLQRQIPYDNAPFTPRALQHFRDPAWVLDERGTCADLALLYAAMCRVGNVVPYLAIVKGHMFVVLDLDSEKPDHGVRPPQGLDSGRDGVLTVPEHCPEFDLALEGGSVVAVDVVGVTTGDERDWTAATAAGAGLIRSRATLAGNDPLLLIDVANLHQAGIGPLRAPRSRRSIRRFAPHLVGCFERYPSRTGLVADLRAKRTGCVAVHGRQGVGKSRLARELMPSAGWFLNASSPETLKASLAEAELWESGVDPGQMEGPDITLYAENAHHRLAEATGGWTVVLDNANDEAHVAAIRDLVPRARPERGQLLIVTSISEVWARQPGFDGQCVPSLDTTDLPPDIQDHSELVDLIGGRPLLIAAFSRLAATTGWTAADLTRRLPPGGDERTEAAGAAALWALVRQCPGIGPDDVELALRLAWLPPDRVPLSLIEPMMPEAGAAVSRLAALGLVELADRLPGFGFLEPEPAVAMHRLVGAALRAEQAAEDQRAADHRVAQILSHEATADLLGQHGERDTIEVIASALSRLVEPEGVRNPLLGRALHGLGTVEELHGGVKSSVDTFTRALRHLDEDDPADGAAIADCLHGRARYVNQHRADDAERVAEALHEARRAVELHHQADRPLGASRAQALAALLRQKEARWAHGKDEKLAILRDVQRSLDATYAERRHLCGDTDDHSLVARARYNRAGVHVDLAKVSPPAVAVGLLDEAEAVYTGVLATRRRLYARQIHNHIACCLSGQAIVAYYRAICLVDEGRAQRVAWLREATDSAVRALGDWQLIDGEVDRGEVRKITELLAKIALARQAFVLAADPVPTFAPVTAKFDEFVDEIDQAQIFGDGPE